MASTYDLFSTNFINPVITPIASQNEEPHYASIRVARTQLHNNAAAIFSPAGGGCHGHLALTMTDVEYFAITNVAFTVPINPTGDPIMLVRSSRLESSENLRKHEEAKKAFKLYHDVHKALRKQLVAPTPEVYLQDLRDPILGYANITCLAIITHLRDTYGEISQEDLDMNTTRIGAVWNPPTPIEDLFEQLRAGAAFATKGGDAPSKTAIACRKWRDKPQVDRTMVQFKKHFKHWEKDRRLMLTTGAAGYHGANHVEPPPAPAADAPLDEMGELQAQLYNIVPPVPITIVS
eukprot:scaffold54635_cov57-Attheya_sp.AAC.2